MKAQAAIEFLTLFSVLLVVLLTISIVTLNSVVTTKKEKEFEIASSICNIISTELEIASKIGDGYWRTLKLPSTIAGKTYNVSVSGYFIEVSWGENHVVCPSSIPSVYGVFVPTTNLIRNVKGEIHVEQA